jgi:hypothetical protein
MIDSGNLYFVQELVVRFTSGKVTGATATARVAGVTEQLVMCTPNLKSLEYARAVLNGA